MALSCGPGLSFHQTQFHLYLLQMQQRVRSRERVLDSLTDCVIDDGPAHLLCELQFLHLWYEKTKTIRCHKNTFLTFKEIWALMFIVADLIGQEKETTISAHWWMNVDECKKKNHTHRQTLTHWALKRKSFSMWQHVWTCTKWNKIEGLKMHNHLYEWF